MPACDASRPPPRRNTRSPSISPGHRALVVKGIMHPDDAVRCVRAGVDAIILSNHGGKALDRAPTPLEMLPSVRAAVGKDIPVMLDSGIRRGSDIVVARCLGADFVFVGRATKGQCRPSAARSR